MQNQKKKERHPANIGTLTNSPEIVVVLLTKRDGSIAIGVHIPDSPGKHKVGIVRLNKKHAGGLPDAHGMSDVKFGLRMRPASINWSPGQPSNFNQLHQIGYIH